MQILLSVSKSVFFLLYLMLDLFLSSFAQKCKVIYAWESMSHMRYITFLYRPIHWKKDSCETRNFIPYSSQIVCGFFNVPHRTYKRGRYYETGPTAYSPYLRRLESLTITYANVIATSVILRPWVMVPPRVKPTTSVRQPDAHPTESPGHGFVMLYTCLTWCRKISYRQINLSSLLSTVCVVLLLQILFNN